jgi:hypothetical protein
MAKNLRVRLLAAATVNGKRSYYKPAMRSTGWPDPAALLVKGRKARIDASQLHAYYVTWLEGKKQQFENVGKDALSAWQAKLNREALLNGVAGAAEQVAKSAGKRVTVADAVEVFLEDVKAGKSVKTHLARNACWPCFRSPAPSSSSTRSPRPTASSSFVSSVSVTTQPRALAPFTTFSKG